MIVVKKDGTRQDFERTKLMSGLQRACRKRPVSSEMMIKVTDEIERELHSLNKSEIPTNEIGKLVMNKLKNLDEVAYVRFASVYLEFNDVKDFVEHIKEEF